MPPNPVFLQSWHQQGVGWFKLHLTQRCPAEGQVGAEGHPLAQLNKAARSCAREGLSQLKGSKAFPKLIHPGRVRHLFLICRGRCRQQRRSAYTHRHLTNPGLRSKESKSSCESRMKRSVDCTIKAEFVPFVPNCTQMRP